MNASERVPVWRADAVRLARLAWRRRLWLLRVNAAAAVLAVVVVLLLPRWYASSVTLVPAPQDGLSLDLGGSGVGVGGASISVGAGPTPQDQLRMVVRSRAVADSLVQAFDLRALWHVKRLAKARDKLADCTTVTTPKEGQVEVCVEARTPRLARDLAAAYARYAALETARLRRSLAAQRRVYLEARLRDLDAELAVASGRLRTFEEQHRTVSLGEQARSTLTADGALRGQLALIETELAATRRYFTDTSPEVRTLSDRAGELRRQLRQLEGGGEALMPGGAALPALKQEYLKLSREQGTLLSVGELLRRVYEQARVEEANPVPTFSVLDAAELPEKHSRPARTATVALSLMLSLVASVLYLDWQERRAAVAARVESAETGPGTEREAA